MENYINEIKIEGENTELKKFEFDLFLKEYALKDTKPRIAEKINELRKLIAQEVDGPMPSEILLKNKSSKENILKVLSYINE